MMGKGQTFLSENEQTRGGEKRHLNIVVSDPDEESCYLVVPITTYLDEDKNTRSEQNNSCLIEAGEHPFIKRKSWAKISMSRCMSFIEIYNGVKRGLLIDKKDILPEVLKRIQENVKSSRFLSGNLKHFRELL
jgi:uncharacterized protein YifN (PemK superfamily)